MAHFTYFIISPGYALKSFVSYPNGDKGNYIKFGDQKSDHASHEGIRGQYLTHNPDIGIAAVMDSSCFADPYLGTRLKNFIIKTIKIPPVGDTEWFSIKTDPCWALFDDMLAWDRRVLMPGDMDKLTEIILKRIG